MRALFTRVSPLISIKQTWQVLLIRERECQNAGNKRTTKYFLFLQFFSQVYSYYIAMLVLLVNFFVNSLSIYTYLALQKTSAATPAKETNLTFVYICSGEL